MCKYGKNIANVVLGLHQHVDKIIIFVIAPKDFVMGLKHVFHSDTRLGWYVHLESGKFWSSALLLCISSKY